MPVSRNYSSTAGRMSLIGAIGAANVSIVVDATVGLPAVPFTLMLDPGVASEEIVEVTAVGGTTLTVSRGIDGTTAQAHLNGAEIRHAYSARDFRDSRVHEAAVGAVHGVAGALVGTTDVQVLTGKVIDYTLNTITNLPVPATFTPNGVSAQTTTYVVANTSTSPLTLITAPSITGDGTKRFKITASGYSVNGMVNAGEYAFVQLREGGTILMAVQRTAFSAGSNGDGFCVVTTVVPTAGAHTYTLVLQRVSADCYVPAAAGHPTEIIVEQIA